MRLSTQSGRIRAYGWHRPLPSRRHIDRHGLLEISPITPFPRVTDLSNMLCPIRDQSTAGSCTSFALEPLLQYVTKAPAPLSELFIYFNERLAEGNPTQDNGANLSDGAQCCVTLGAPPETDWPYDLAQLATKPPDAAYMDALQFKAASDHSILTLRDMMGCLAQGFPFVVGITVYESFESDAVAASGVVPLPGPSEQNLGGHAVCVVGYDMTTEQFKVRNSWGTSWGQAGYFLLPFNYLTDSSLADDGWSLR